jgi:hypothetical protein
MVIWGMFWFYTGVTKYLGKLVVLYMEQNGLRANVSPFALSF